MSFTPESHFARLEPVTFGHEDDVLVFERLDCGALYGDGHLQLARDHFTIDEETRPQSPFGFGTTQRANIVCDPSLPTGEM